MAVEPVSQDSERRERSTVSLLEIASLVVRKRRLIAVSLFAVMALTAVVLLFTPNQYRSRATILPSQRTDKLENLKAMAGLFGSSLPVDGTPELFPTILRSRRITDAVLNNRYMFERDSRDTSLTLVEFFGDPSRDRLHAKLAGITEISTDKKTGTITLAVETEYPELSQAIVRQYLRELERYNLNSRTTQAKQTEQYLAREVASREAALLAAQDSLRLFRERNRNWNNTTNPSILAELDRLTREVAILEQSYIFLSREHESAKLEVAMDTPMLTVLDEPSLPDLKSGPFRTMILMAIGLLTLTVTVIMIVFYEGFRRRAYDEQALNYERLRDDVRRAFPTTSRLVLRARSFAGSMTTSGRS